MEAKFEVFISDTIHGPTERRTYKSRERAMARYEELRRTHRRNGHSTVILRQDEVQIFPAPICGH